MSNDGWKKAMVVFTEAAIAGADSLPRSERHRMRKAASDAKRSEILACLSDAGLADEAELPEASPSSSLLIEASPRALDEVRKAPSVEKVLPIAGDAVLDLIE